MLKEIREQPEHIRAIFMWLSVFIVFSLIVFVWFSSFQKKLAFLLSPEKEEAAEQSRLPLGNRGSSIKSGESPLAVIGRGLGDLKATIADLFGLAGGTKKETEVIDNLEKRFNIEPRLLPLSE